MTPTIILPTAFTAQRSCLFAVAASLSSDLTLDVEPTANVQAPRRVRLLQGAARLLRGLALQIPTWRTRAGRGTGDNPLRCCEDLPLLCQWCVSHPPGSMRSDHAAGYCRRGDSCWFKHVKPASSQVTLEDAVEDDPCSICFEKPTTYGLLGEWRIWSWGQHTNRSSGGCSHVFCLECLRQWRDPTGKTEDLVQSRAHKKCPMCRAKSAFITPSSVFIKHGDPAKDKVIQAYKESMAKRPCRCVLPLLC